MNTSTLQTKYEASGSVQENVKIAEEQEMRMANEITELKARISRSMTSKIAVKLVGGFVLGALVVTTVIGLTYGSTNADAAANSFSTEVVGSTRLLNQGQAGYSMEEQLEITGTFAVPKSPKVERVDDFLNQGSAGYSMEEQMEITGTFAVPKSPKVERVDGFLNQGSAGYSMEDQLELNQD